MTINFYEGKENKPNRLFIQPDRVTMYDRIILTEAYYAVDDKAAHFYGLLHSESVGIENSKDRAWKVDSQKVLVSCYKSKKPTWNNETRKFEDKEVELSENYLYGFAKDALKNIETDCVSAVIAPYVNPQFLEEIKKPSLDETTVAYWEARVKNTIVVTPLSATTLTDVDKGVLTAIASSTSSFSGGKSYQKVETEAEKLEARFEFLRRHLGRDYSSITTLYELGVLLAHTSSDADSVSDQLALAKSIDLITRMWQNE
ncbi:hypothetical protein [Microcoleus sp. D2_18a_B4]|uniref:hypothetical protein n=1 Tax=Microcoleus sp. D2_18a_B4 TaxID=3055329 RepID=UPI002FCFE57A